MLNTQGLFAVVSVLSLVIFVPTGLVRFAVDWWGYYHASNPANAHLSITGPYLVLTGVAWFAVFYSIFLFMDWSFKNRVGRQP